MGMNDMTPARPVPKTGSQIVDARAMAAQRKWNCEKSGCGFHWLDPDFTAIARMLPESMGRCRPSDLDAIVERNGHFLVVEFKSKLWRPERDGRIGVGQRIMLERMSQIPNWTVYVVHGLLRPHDPITAMAAFRDGRMRPFFPATEDDLRVEVEKWAAKAEAARPTTNWRQEDVAL